jgi:hypothetical protein
VVLRRSSRLRSEKEAAIAARDQHDRRDDGQYGSPRKPRGVRQLGPGLACGSGTKHFADAANDHGHPRSESVVDHRGAPQDGGSAPRRTGTPMQGKRWAKALEPQVG